MYIYSLYILHSSRSCVVMKHVWRFSPLTTLVAISALNLMEDPVYGIAYIIILVLTFLSEFWAKYTKYSIIHTYTEISITSIVAILSFFLFCAKTATLGPIESILAGILFGTVFGPLGFTLGHEFGHKKEWYHKILSRLLFTIAGYPHFLEIHNSLHHRFIGTATDLTTAKPKQAVSSYLHQQFKSYFKEMTIYSYIANVLLLVFLSDSIIFVLTSQIVGWFFLEMVNFVQHYGLQREDKIDEHLSWDTHNDFSNAFLFNLGRHGDHHIRASLWHSELEFKSRNKKKDGYFTQIVKVILGGKNDN